MEKHEVIAILQEEGINPTIQRVDIAMQLFSKAQHLSADEVLSAVTASGRGHISKATVYNTLNLFAEHGLLRELLVDASRVYYDSNTRAHHHIYNVDTGELLDVDGDISAQMPLPPLPDGTVSVGVEVIYRVRTG